jgi:hypothetical protein
MFLFKLEAKLKAVVYCYWKDRKDITTKTKNDFDFVGLFRYTTIAVEIKLVKPQRIKMKLIELIEII